MVDQTDETVPFLVGKVDSFRGSPVINPHFPESHFTLIFDEIVQIVDVSYYGLGEF